MVVPVTAYGLPHMRARLSAGTVLATLLYISYSSSSYYHSYFL